MIATLHADDTRPTLRTRLLKPLPSLAEPHMLPNPDPNHDIFHNYIINPNSNHALVDELIQECAIWIARAFADCYNYHSDSTIDSHDAMIAALAELNGLIYGNDQTMSTEEAILLWVDDPDQYMDLACAANPNASLSDEINNNRPRLFEYFDLENIFGDEDPSELPAYSDTLWS